MAVVTLYSLVASLITAINAGPGAPVPQGFPDNWQGDQYYKSTCPVSQNFPAWLDGYFFCQTFGSFGKQANARGQKVTHLFDPISALAVFDVNPVRSTFTGHYYPTKQQKIWNFYGRNMAQSKVCWFPGYTPFNLTMYKMWKNRHDGLLDTNPDLDFWKIGNQVISATESAKVFMTYNISTVSDFRYFSFNDTSPYITSPRYVQLNMPVHERQGPDGSIFSSFLAVDTANIDFSKGTGTGHFLQLVFSVTPDGVRTVYPPYQFPTFNLSDCDPVTKRYTGPVINLGSYMHSVTSTEHVVILPMTSLVLNPCLFRFGRLNPAFVNATVIDPRNSTQVTLPWYYEPKLPLRFLVFDKSSKKFITKTPLAYTTHKLVTHQWNAYQPSNSNEYVADMITYDCDPYESIYIEKLLQPGQVPFNGTAQRFTINVDTKSIKSSLLFPPGTTNIEFPQFNHNFEGKLYQWGYVLHSVYTADSEIWKISMNDPSGEANVIFAPGSDFSMSEPIFVQTPGKSGEDEGVIIVRALDVSVNRSVVFVLDAQTLQPIGKLDAPTLVPFGFHNRYFSRASLGMKPTTNPPPRNPAPQGFPAAWNGDKYYQSKCKAVLGNTEVFPQWVDGFFFVQTCGSYGDQSNPLGQKLLHMFDGISGMVLFDINPNQSLFTGRYYPTRVKAIWEFYQRDMSQSKVAWGTGYSPYNQTQAKVWETYDTQLFDYGPDVDFWKVGHSIISATEFFGVGLTFDIPQATNYQPYPFKDTDQLFVNPGNPIAPSNMPVHERVEPDGTIYAAILGFNTTGVKANKTTGNYIQADGTRTIEGSYVFPQFDLKNCNTTTYRYQGDKNALPGYMHSITSTTDTVILPITSVVFDPCIYLYSGGPDPKAVLVDPTKFPRGAYYKADMPLRFLVFSKAERKFLTPSPLMYSTARWVSHQWNGYRLSNGKIVADMITYDHDVYNDLYIETLLNTTAFPRGTANRFTIDLQAMTVSSQDLMPAEYGWMMEFSQFNHDYEGKPYKYGYVVRFPYMAGSQIVKITMDDPTGNSYKFFTVGPRVSLAEPWFRSKPGASKEDQGVLFVRGLDIDTNRATVYVIDAQTMQLISTTLAPASVPFGFHNRFYTRTQLGMSPTTTVPPGTTKMTSATVANATSKRSTTPTQGAENQKSVTSAFSMILSLLLTAVIMK